MKWNFIESNHYIFYVYPVSVAIKEINEIMDIQERCFCYMRTVLSIDIEEKICETEDEVDVYSEDFSL